MVKIPTSILNYRILYILKKEKYIKKFKFITNLKYFLIQLKYTYTNKILKSYITTLKRISKPSLKQYITINDLKKETYKKIILSNKKGIYILSTSKGLITDIIAKKLKIGGELLFFVS